MRGQRLLLHASSGEPSRLARAKHRVMQRAVPGLLARARQQLIPDA